MLGEVRDHSEAREPQACFDLRNPRLEQRAIAAELIDDESGDAAPLVIVQQRDGPEQAREHAAAVDVGDEHAAGVRRLGHA
jgi:hypothetical protein